MSARLPRVVPLIGVLGIGGLVTLGVLPRARRAEAVEAQRQAVLLPRRVVTTTAVLASPKMSFSLQGTAAPVKSAIVTARSMGFVHQLFVDLGDTVKAGQPLAVLEAPDVDEEVKRAQARLTEAETNVGLSRSSAERAARLSEQGVASKQQAEEAQSRLTSAIAAVDTARADVLRVTAVRGYARVVAPFAGVIIRRFIEQGALATADRAPLFEVAQTDTLKVVVEVPQWLASDIAVGAPVKIAEAVHAGPPIDAKVTRAAGALDPMTRTMRVEIAIDAPGRLLPNAFVQVTFEVTRTSPPVVVSAAALSTRAEGTRVFEVFDGAVTVRPVTVARDQGRVVELSGGIAPGAQLVVNPPADLEAGEKVRVALPDGGTR